MDLKLLASLLPGMGALSSSGGQFDALGEEWRGFRQDVRELVRLQGEANKLLTLLCTDTGENLGVLTQSVGELRQQLADYHDKAAASGVRHNLEAISHG